MPVIRQMLLTGVLGMASLSFVATASGQGNLPDRNPIFVSLTGTNAEPVIFRDVNLSTYHPLHPSSMRYRYMVRSEPRNASTDQAGPDFRH